MAGRSRLPRLGRPTALSLRAQEQRRQRMTDSTYVAVVDGAIGRVIELRPKSVPGKRRELAGRIIGEFATKNGAVRAVTARLQALPDDAEPKKPVD